MQLAVAAPGKIKQRLKDGGWRVIDPLEVTRTPAAYQTYLRRSLGEWCVAKHGYVSTRCGWFSDRSAAYLAAGRPVITQDTGFGNKLPVGEGLFPFMTSEDVLKAVDAINSDYARHSRAATEIAREFFRHDRVLTEILKHSGL